MQIENVMEDATVVTMGAPPVQPKEDDLPDAMRGWMKNEITKASERVYDLGKFFFTVSIGTAGLVATLYKASKSPVAIFAIVACALSAIFALALAWPKTWRLSAYSNLSEEYNDLTTTALLQLKAWSVIYLVAFASSVLAILTQP